MKKILLLTVAMVLVASVAFGATIVGSRHDLSTANQANGQVCVFCHTPHNANTSAGPLWSHSTSQATFSIYTSATLNGTISQPSGTSKACMGCHDGTVGVGVISNGRSAGSYSVTGHDGASSYAVGAKLSGGALLGTDLRDDHPVSITYRNDLDAELRAPTGATVVNGGNTLQLYGTASPYTVECASCHSVHTNTNVPFLRISNTNSALCTTCHLK